MYFSFNVQVKSAPLLIGRNVYAEKGVLPRSSHTARTCSCSMFSSWQNTSFPRTSKDTPLALKRNKKHGSVKELGEESAEGGKVWQAVIMRQEFIVEIPAMNNATVLPLERKRPWKNDFSRSNGWNSPLQVPQEASVSIYIPIWSDPGATNCALIKIRTTKNL